MVKSAGIILVAQLSWVNLTIHNIALNCSARSSYRQSNGNNIHSEEKIHNGFLLWHLQLFLLWRLFSFILLSICHANWNSKLSGSKRAQHFKEHPQTSSYSNPINPLLMVVVVSLSSVRRLLSVNIF